MPLSEAGVELSRARVDSEFSVGPEASCANVQTSGAEPARPSPSNATVLASHEQIFASEMSSLASCTRLDCARVEGVIRSFGLFHGCQGTGS